MNEEEARRRDVALSHALWLEDLIVHPYTRRGFVKVLTVPGKDRIVGVTTSQPFRRVIGGTSRHAPRARLTKILSTITSIRRSEATSMPRACKRRQPPKGLLRLAGAITSVAGGWRRARE